MKWKEAHCRRWPKKLRFESAIAADLRLLEIQCNPPPGAVKIPIRSYRCPDCDDWHLTSQPER